MTGMRVACVGAGYFSQFHRESWGRMDEVGLVAVCDRDLSAAQATGLPAYDNLVTMLASVQPDVLDVILPPPAHAAVIRTALAAGTQWIICQKPFCTDTEEARAVTAQVEAAGATLIIHENFRFQPWYRAIKTLLDEGLLGQVTNATFRLRPGDGQGPRAYLDRQPYFQQMPRFLVRETAVHWVDTFRFLFGPPDSVYADLRKLNPAIAGEDAGLVIFDHGNGLRAVFDGNRLIDHAADNTRRTMGEALIEGTAGVLTLWGDGSVRHRSFGATEDRIVVMPSAEQNFGGDCVHALQSHVHAAWCGAVAPENTAREYMDVLRIVDAIYTSDAEARRIMLG